MDLIYICALEDAGGDVPSHAFAQQSEMTEEQLESAFEHQEAEDDALVAPAVAMQYPLAADRRQVSLQAERGVGRNDVLDAAADADVARRLDAEIEWGGAGAPVFAEMASHTVDLAPRRRPKSSVVGNDVTWHCQSFD